MKSLLHRVRAGLRSSRARVALFSMLAIPTALCALPQVGGSGPSPIGRPLASGGAVTLTASLAQTSLPQGGDGRAAIEFSIGVPPADIRTSGRQESDIVVVLDRSPSMQVDNRLPYAVQAIRELVERLNENDRIAFVSFDASAISHLDLERATPSTKAKLREQLDHLPSSGGTNIGAGLEMARDILARHASNRPRQVILLSDGEANIGTISTEGLTALARTVSSQKAVVSTIGLGLGFNESLMSAIADVGMGNYSYLEQVASLGTILDKHLQDTRQQFASLSTLELTVTPGSSIADASGYPYTQKAPGKFEIPTGQLLYGSNRTFFVTVQVPTGTIGKIPALLASLQYQTREGEGRATLSGTELAFNIIPAERKEELRASVNAPVFDRAWQLNALGNTKRAVANALKNGDREMAQQAIVSYRADLKKAEEATGRKVKSDVVASEVDALEERSKDAFAGAPAEQELKRNRFAKEVHLSANADQRKK